MNHLRLVSSVRVWSVRVWPAGLFALLGLLNGLPLSSGWCQGPGAAADQRAEGGELSTIRRVADGEAAVDWSTLVGRSPWIFLGDSNTYGGEHIALMHAFLRETMQANGQAAPEVLNLGVPSETVAGTSEVDHPFKRPCLLERLDKVLHVMQPQVVFLSYGMNDGIYQPPNDEVFQAYQAGMRRAVRKIQATGATAIVLTPSMFESEPVAAAGKLGPNQAGRYAYSAPSADYDSTLKAMAAWCMENAMDADAVIDVHTAMHWEKSRIQRQKPGFQFTTDGVHYNRRGHAIVAAIVAEAILSGLGAASTELEELVSDADRWEADRRNMRLLRDAYLASTGKNRPGLTAGWPPWYARQLISRPGNAND